MNCRPGDLAVVVGSGPHAGRLVEVIGACPPFDFIKHDGRLNEGLPAGWWELKALGSPFIVEAESSFGFYSVETMSPCLPDSALRPLLGKIDETETNTTTGVKNYGN